MSVQITGASIAIAAIARAIFALPFVVFGIVHLVSVQQMAPMVPMPNGAFWVGFTGVCMIAAGVSLIIDRAVWLSMPLLALLLCVYIVFLHIPELFEPQTQAMGMAAILKNLGLAGGALAFAVLYPRERR